MDDEKGGQEMRYHFIDEVRALVTDQFDGAAESRDHLLP